ncbi:MAG: tRNA lysidine(34) synthetase TilS [bacterium]
MPDKKKQILSAQQVGERLGGLATAEERSVLIALSGGPDSVALLHLMVELAKEQGFKPYAAHVNYKLRGAESDAEEKFCCELCRNLRIRLFVKRRSLKNLRSGNLQEKAREVRYQFFEQLCEKHDIDLVATGHNADDNAETILFNLARGAGTFGLGGIAERTGRVIRPLLRFTRQQILEYLRHNGLTHCTDSSNLTEKYKRNQIRQRLLPEFESIFGSASVENVGRSGRLLAEQADFLRGEAEQCFARVAGLTRAGKIVIAWQGLMRYHTLLRRLTLAVAYERLTGSLRGFELAATDRLLALGAKGQGRADFIDGLVSEVVADRLYIYRPRGLGLSRKLALPGVVEIDRLSCRISAGLITTQSVSRRELGRGGNVANLDPGQVKAPLVVRLPRAGDRFRPLGMTGSKKLSDFFVDRKIDRPLRDELLIVEDAEKIIWVAGVEISDEVKVTARTKRILRLELDEIQDD